MTVLFVFHSPRSMGRKAELKQDDIVESSNIVEAEEIIASPGEQSESVSPGLDAMVEPQPSSVESYQTFSSEKPVAGTPVQLDWQSNSCIGDEMEDNVLDIKSIPPNPELERLLEEFCCPVQQTTDGKMFSPLHSQMQSVLGQPLFYNGDINDNQQTFPFQYGTNPADDIESFLSSVFIEPEEQSLADIYDNKYMNMAVKQSNSCCESEGEVSQKQDEHLTLPVESFEENIKLESPFQSEVSSEMPAFEQNKHSSYFSNDYDQRNFGYANNFSGLPNDFTTLSSDNHIGHVSNVENTSLYNPVVEDTTSGTGIVIRKRQNPSQSTMQNNAAHGTASRRLRLQVQCSHPNEPTNTKCTQEGDRAKDDKAAKTEPVELTSSSFDDAKTDGSSNDSSKNMKSTTDTPYITPEEKSSLRSACAVSVSSSRYMPKVLMTMSLIVMLIAVWAYSTFPSK